MTAIAACRTCGTEPLEHARFCHSRSARRWRWRSMQSVPAWRHSPSRGGETARSRECGFFNALGRG
jgi:hypothetical protein